MLGECTPTKTVEVGLVPAGDCSKPWARELGKRVKEDTIQSKSCQRASYGQSNNHSQIGDGW